MDTDITFCGTSSLAINIPQAMTSHGHKYFHSLLAHEPPLKGAGMLDFATEFIQNTAAKCPNVYSGKPCQSTYRKCPKDAASFIDEKIVFCASALLFSRLLAR